MVDVAELHFAPLKSVGKCISAVMLTLKTAKGMKTLRLAPQLHDALQKEKVRVGDVVFVEANTGPFHPVFFH